MFATARLIPTAGMIAMLLALSALTTGCKEGLQCSDRGRRQSLDNATPVYHVGCDPDDRCSTSEYVCWNEAVRGIQKRFKSGKGFVVRYVLPASSYSNVDEYVWVVRPDRSGTLYRRNREDAACNTSSKSVDEIVRKRDGNIEFRERTRSWTSLDNLQSGVGLCKADALPTRAYPGETMHVLEGYRWEDFSEIVADSGELYVAGAEWESEADSQVRIAKYRRDGSVEWRTLVGSTHKDFARDLAVGPGGAVYAVGHKEGTFQTGDEEQFKDDAGFVAKFSPTGELQWVKSFPHGTHEYRRVRGVAVDGSGGVYAVGRMSKPLEESQNPGENSVGFVVKFDSAGTRRWLEYVSTSGDEGFRDVVADDSGRIWAVGRTTGGFGPSSGDGTDFDLAVVSYSTSGRQYWRRSFGTPRDDIGLEVALGRKHLYLTGSALDREEGLSTDPPESDALVAAVSRSGDRKWFERVEKYGRVQPADVAVTSSGTVEIVGETSSGLGLDVPVIDSRNGFHMRFDRSGTMTSRQLVATTKHDALVDIVALDSGELFIGGFFKGLWKNNDVGADDGHAVDYFGRLE